MYGLDLYGQMKPLIGFKRSKMEESINTVHVQRGREDDFEEFLVAC